jgi:UDP-3-O-[3-hydroxymyristoyl] glucosamine N-acyltransferase
MKLRDLAEQLHCRLEGDGDIDIARVAALETAGPGEVTFLANAKYHGKVAHTRASAIIADDTLTAAPCAIVRCAQPYLAFARALSLLAPEQRPPAGIHPSAVVDASAVIDADASIGALACIGAAARVGARTVVHPFAYVGPEAHIGADCVVHAHVSIRERVVIGDRVVIQNGAVLGSDGYGFAPRPDGTFEKIPQHGGIVVEDDVEIGAGTTVDRPPMGDTRIAAGTKIDNLVQVGHGVQVGKHVLLAAQTGISGSSVIEDHVVLAGQVGVAGHLTIGTGTRATAQSGIPNDVAAGSFISGYPAIDNRDWLKASAVFKKLPEMRKTLADLERRLARLEGRADDQA